ncbi:MAG: hypothetical protein AB1646_11775 [Thermodesulfobacteriota bacterium]
MMTPALQAYLQLLLQSLYSGQRLPASNESGWSPLNAQGRAIGHIGWLSRPPGFSPNWLAENQRWAQQQREADEGRDLMHANPLETDAFARARLRDLAANDDTYRQRAMQQYGFSWDPRESPYVPGANAGPLERMDARLQMGGNWAGPTSSWTGTPAFQQPKQFPDAWNREIDDIWSGIKRNSAWESPDKQPPRAPTLAEDSWRGSGWYGGGFQPQIEGSRPGYSISPSSGSSDWGRPDPFPDAQRRDYDAEASNWEGWSPSYDAEGW